MIRPMGAQNYNKSFLQKCSDRLIVFFVWLLILGIALSYYIIYLPTLLTRNETESSIHFNYNNLFNHIPAVSFKLCKNNLFIAWLPKFRAYQELPAKKSVGNDQKNNLTEATETQNKTVKPTQQQLEPILAGVNENQVSQQIQQMRTNQFCPKCNIVRPPRAHHCSVCRKCILRMDHHCPWTGNCIGQYNHKYFILFLLYATLGLGIVAFSIIIDWIKGEGGVIDSLEENWKKYITIATGLTSLVLMMSIGFLLSTQLISAMINLTTLQSFTQGIEDNPPFDRGSICENYKDIFGEKGCSILPTKPLFRFQSQYQIEHSLY